MIFKAHSRCHTCSVPLHIVMYADTPYEHMYWYIWQDMFTRLSLTNYICYKRIGKKWIHLCIDCFKCPPSKFHHILHRELKGNKFIRPKKTALKDTEVDFMIRSMIHYEKQDTDVKMAEYYSHLLPVP